MFSSGLEGGSQMFLLICLDVGMIKRNVIAATKPDITVEADGDTYTFTTHTALKTIKITFTLGQEYEADPGTDKIAKVINLRKQFTFFCSTI